MLSIQEIKEIIISNSTPVGEDINPDGESVWVDDRYIDDEDIDLISRTIHELISKS